MPEVEGSRRRSPIVLLAVVLFVAACGDPRPRAGSAETAPPAAPAPADPQPELPVEPPPSPGLRSAEAAPAGSEDDPARLAGLVWSLRIEPGISTRPIPDGFHITIAFDLDGAVRGHSGCNDYSGRVRIDRGKLGFGPLASTMKACSAPAMELERSYMAHLEQVNGFAIREERLQLLRGDRPILVFVPTE
ncbi:MAG TPA: META domain-containing protein [Candidatus Polarisedimenticolaceae bacterium]|nr:META domain-containing protein [Candidatus Polarisedimenticolaceae bacterium]